VNPRALVLLAATGFDGSQSALSKATGVPLRTLANFASGTYGGSAALRMLLSILAANPNVARQLVRNTEGM
jgi:hypothetical protein